MCRVRRKGPRTPTRTIIANLDCAYFLPLSLPNKKSHLEFTSSLTQIFSPLMRVICVTMESGSRAPATTEKVESSGEGGLVEHLERGGVGFTPIPTPPPHNLDLNDTPALRVGLGLRRRVAWVTSSIRSDWSRSTCIWVYQLWLNAIPSRKYAIDQVVLCKTAGQS